MGGNPHVPGSTARHTLSIGRIAWAPRRNAQAVTPKHQLYGHRARNCPGAVGFDKGVVPGRANSSGVELGDAEVVRKYR
ncbi:MAG: hypothetical protein QOJ06_1275 [Pseudonocardiales bacterium]|jgi:hypothetical protein|nr:hypothetical protein [Pseudonocardiales bacterium]